METDYDGEPLHIGFNAKYLLDVLGVIDSQSIRLCLKDELSPALVRPLESEEFISVIMPMRL
jgi:DNA polymerase-3 subunit beta